MLLFTSDLDETPENRGLRHYELVKYGETFHGADY